MHVRTWLAAICGLTLAAGTASAAGVGAFGAYWDTKEADGGFGAGAKLCVKFLPLVELELRGTFFEDLTENIDGDETKLQAIPAEAGIIVRLGAAEEEPSLYAGVGGSYYFLELDDLDIDDELGWYGEVGVQVPLGDTGWALFAEALYRSVEATVNDDDLDLIEDEVSLDLQGLGANVGLMVLW